MTNILKLFGERVKEIRKAQGLSQEDLAERANLHNTYIGGVERGERNLSLKSIEKIALALKISANIFFEKRNALVVSEESESELYASNKKSCARTREQELLKHFRLLKDDELKKCVIKMIKLVSKTK